MFVFIKVACTIRIMKCRKTEMASIREELKGAQTRQLPLHLFRPPFFLIVVMTNNAKCECSSLNNE